MSSNIFLYDYVIVLSTDASKSCLTINAISQTLKVTWDKCAVSANNHKPNWLSL
jgi:hypothetical protein